MALNVNTSNYINTNAAGAGNSANVSAQVSMNADGAIVSIRGLDLKPGQTLSGQVVEIDGKDIRLLLSDNSTINARLEGNINALLGQTLSFEVKTTDNGLTALRPLYTNLSNSPAAEMAIKSAGLPLSDNYIKMVSAMMDEGMPINKNAIYNMSKSINSFPDANPETVVRLNKLGLSINELTINQYENYKGLERQITGDIDTLTDALTNIIKDSLKEYAKGNGVPGMSGAEPGAKNLLTSLLNAFSKKDSAMPADETGITGNEAGVVSEDDQTADALKGADGRAFNENTDTLAGLSKDSDFKLAKMVFDMIDEEPENAVSKALEAPVKELARLILNENTGMGDALSETAGKIINNGDIPVSVKDALQLVKSMLDKMESGQFNNESSIKERLGRLISGDGFLKLTKNALTRQMLLEPKEVTDSKNIEELYLKIIDKARAAVEILNASGKDNPELLNAAKNINDNVSFMNELNQVVTYVQLPLLMNGKSAHGDLYVYTKKKNLINNDGNISALLHLDMENLGPMDVYVALSEGKKLNTHFYMKDEATIDFIYSHIDILNAALTKKGYRTDINVTEADKNKPLNMADEFLKDKPTEGSVSKAVKYSFDVRA